MSHGRHTVRVKPWLTKEWIILYAGFIEFSRKPFLRHHLFHTPDRLFHQSDCQFCLSVATVKAMSADSFQLDRCRGHLRPVLLQKAFPHQIDL